MFYSTQLNDKNNVIVDYYAVDNKYNNKINTFPRIISIRGPFIRENYFTASFTHFIACVHGRVRPSVTQQTTNAVMHYQTGERLYENGKLPCRKSSAEIK